MNQRMFFYFPLHRFQLPYAAFDCVNLGAVFSSLQQMTNVEDVQHLSVTWPPALQNRP